MTSRPRRSSRTALSPQIRRTHEVPASPPLRQTRDMQEGRVVEALASLRLLACLEVTPALMVRCFRPVTADGNASRRPRKRKRTAAQKKTHADEEFLARRDGKRDNERSLCEVTLLSILTDCPQTPRTASRQAKGRQDRCRGRRRECTHTNTKRGVGEECT